MLESAMSTVYPSGFAFATAALPTAPPAPGRFDTTTGCFRIFSIAAAVGLPVTSATPPGGKGTIIVIARDGNDSCATAVAVANAAAHAAKSVLIVISLL